MPYILIFSFLFYAFIVKMFSHISTYASAALVVFIPFIAQLVINLIFAFNYGSGWGGAITASVIVTVIVQFLVAVFVFAAIKKYEDDFVEWGFFVGIGAVLLYLVIPNVMILLLGR